MRKKILSLLAAALLLTMLLPAAAAVTTQELNQPTVFLKQQNRGTCTLASTAMMLRRAAMLRGDGDWATITESAIRPSVWRSGRGLPYHFSWNGLEVAHEFLPGGQANTQVLVDVLEAHPEGIMLHASGVPHGVLLTDYTDGIFYCADPANSYPEGRIPIEEAYGTRITNSTAYWYVTSVLARPLAEEPKEEKIELPAVTAGSPLSKLVDQIQDEGETVSQLHVTAKAQV